MNNGSHSETAGMKLAERFKSRFNITKTCAGLDPNPAAELCAFAVDTGLKPGFAYAHPFVVPNVAFYFPVEEFSTVVPWIMQNRGELDVLVHPNSGELCTCALRDLVGLTVDPESGSLSRMSPFSLRMWLSRSLVLVSLGWQEVGDQWRFLSVWHQVGTAVLEAACGTMH